MNKSKTRRVLPYCGQRTFAAATCSRSNLDNFTLKEDTRGMPFDYMTTFDPLVSIRLSRTLSFHISQILHLSQSSMYEVLLKEIKSWTTKI